MADAETKAKADVAFILLKRKEQWRLAQQRLVAAGNEIAVDDVVLSDIQQRLYEWSDEALNRSRECGEVLRLLDD